MTYVIYHGNCFDGFGAAYALWTVYGKDAVYIPALYGNPPPEVPADADVIMVDISYRRDVMKAFRAKVNSLVVLDHHKTAQAELAGLDQEIDATIIFDMNHSGAYLAWKYCHEEESSIPLLLLYVEDRDLWRHNMSGSREVHAALTSYPFDFELWREFTQNDIEELINEGYVIMRAMKTQIDIITKNVVWYTIGNYYVPVVNTTAYFSEVAHRLLEMFPAAPFSAYYIDRADYRQWGLRSEDHRVDVSEIAKLYGGGGHRNASGFETKKGYLFDEASARGKVKETTA